ncbi:MAG: hypothetical protein NZL92_12125, partial [Gloeomargarita sp. SKYG116]|nr:hypothetical protein [Gloeomargarita sp. SKYG116]MDW8402426.1 hypothetical protein [Gloeomargarita sp. SKYGB_i_bin116]
MRWWRVGVCFILALFIAITPVTWAQTPTPTVAEETAPVILDGQELFRVPAANVFSAQERAKAIANRLE